MEKALIALGAEGADEKQLHRAAARRVEAATGRKADTVRDKHRQVVRKLSAEDREDYRTSLSPDRKVDNAYVRAEPDGVIVESDSEIVKSDDESPT